MLMNGYRALDLSEGGGLLCGKILADMGVDVLKIEEPGGSVSRNIGPYYEDVADPEKSLFWFAYNEGKRSVTLNLETDRGRDIFKNLVKTADFVIESFTPGYLEKIGLGYEDLAEINPRLILISITFFGQTGPKAGHKACDLTAWASGGELFASGDPDRPPVWVGYPQASLHGGLQAAAMAMIAHWHREKTGEGQHVDVSIQECVLLLTEGVTPAWELYQEDIPRMGSGYPGRLKLHTGFGCRDGYVNIYIMGGDVTMLNSCKALQKWMEEEDAAPDWFRGFNWEKEYDASKMTQQTVDRVEGIIGDFLQTKTKQEIFEAAMSRGILAAPARNMEDICKDEHLAERDFWHKVEHPEINEAIPYCGFPAKASEPDTLKRMSRAPHIGENNLDIYVKELGLSRETLDSLRKAKII